MNIEDHVGQGIDQLFSQGILGVLLVGACAVIIVLWRQNRDLQNARVEDVKSMGVETVKALSNASASSAALAVATTDGNRLLQVVVDVSRPLAAGQEALATGLQRTADKIDALHKDVMERR